jgi:hypothetical protein
MWIRTDYENVLDVEVKVPRAFRPDPHRTAQVLFQDEATKRVAEAIRSAAGGNDPQMKRDGLVLIGAFHLSKEEESLIEQAVTNFFAARPGRYTQVMAVSIVVATAYLAESPTGDKRIRPGGQVHLVQNPNYSGPLSIRDRYPGSGGKPVTPPA